MEFINGVGGLRQKYREYVEKTLNDTSENSVRRIKVRGELTLVGLLKKNLEKAIKRLKEQDYNADNVYHLFFTALSNASRPKIFDYERTIARDVKDYLSLIYSDISKKIKERVEEIDVEDYQKAITVVINEHKGLIDDYWRSINTSKALGTDIGAKVEKVQQEQKEPILEKIKTTAKKVGEAYSQAREEDEN